MAITPDTAFQPPASMPPSMRNIPSQADDDQPPATTPPAFSTPGGTLTAPNRLRETPQDTQVAVAPAIAGGALAAELALACGIVLTVAYIKWQADQNPEIIQGAAREIQQKLADTAALLQKVGVEVVVPTLKSIEGQITSLFQNIKSGAVSLGEAGRALIDSIWPQSRPQAPQQETQQAPPSISAAASQQTPRAVPRQQTPQVVPRQQPSTTSPSTTSAPPVQAQAPVNLRDLPVGRQQIALVQSGQTNAQQAQKLMDSASSQVMPLNRSIQQFYDAASGGTAARSAGTPQQALREVQQLRDGLGRTIQQANDPIAAVQTSARSLQRIYGNPANRGRLFDDLAGHISSLNGVHQSLADARNSGKAMLGSLDAWLAQAYKHVADGNQPLPPPPLVLKPGNVSNDPAAQGIQTAYEGARNALTRSGTQTQQKPQADVQQPQQAQVQNPAQPAEAPTPRPAQLVERMPADVTSTAPIWINKTTGRASATEQVGPDWVRADVGVAPWPADQPGSNGKPGLELNAKQQVNQFVREQNVFPGGGGPDPNRWLVPLLLGIGAGSGVYVVVQQNQGLDLQRESLAEQRETKWSPPASLNPPPTPSTVTTQSSSDDKAKAIVETYRHYLGQAQTALRSSPYAHRDPAKKDFGNADLFKLHGDAYLRQLETMQQQIAKAPDLQSKQALLRAMDTTPFNPALNLGTDGQSTDAGRPDGVSGPNDRPQKVVNTLVQLVNAGARQSLPGILNVPGTATEIAEDPINRLMGATKLRGDDTPRTVAPSQPTANAPTTVQTQPAPQAPSDAPRALAAVRDAIRQGVLPGTQPPGLDKADFNDIRFSEAMFIPAGKGEDYGAVLAAYNRLGRLSEALRTLKDAQPPLSTATKTQIADLRNRLITDVGNPMAQRVHRLSQQPASPAVTPEPTPSATPSSTPSATPTPTDRPTDNPETEPTPLPDVHVPAPRSNTSGERP